MKERYEFYADFLNGHEEDGEPVPQKETSIVIGKKVKEKNLWYKLRHFLRRV